MDKVMIYRKSLLSVVKKLCAVENMVKTYFQSTSLSKKRNIEAYHHSGLPQYSVASCVQNIRA